MSSFQYHLIFDFSLMGRRFGKYASDVFGVELGAYEAKHKK
jgi:hypothetical protein